MPNDLKFTQHNRCVHVCECTCTLWNSWWKTVFGTGHPSGTSLTLGWRSVLQSISPTHGGLIPGLVNRFRTKVIENVKYTFVQNNQSNVFSFFVIVDSSWPSKSKHGVEQRQLWWVMRQEGLNVRHYWGKFCSAYHNCRRLRNSWQTHRRRCCCSPVAFLAWVHL